MNYMYINFVSLQPVPTDVWVQILTERLKLMDCVKKGYVLEGFPQTREQALALQSVGIHPKHCGMKIVCCMYTCNDLYKSWFVDITQSYSLLTISFEDCLLKVCWILTRLSFVIFSYSWCTRHSPYWASTRKAGGSQNWRCVPLI